MDTGLPEISILAIGVSLSAFQVALEVKKLLANIGNRKDMGSIPGLGRSSGGGHGNPIQYSCLENVYGQRSLAGHSPWSCKESDMTEPLSTQDLLNQQIYFRLWWVFVAACGLSLVLASGGLPSSCGARASHCGGFPCYRAQALGQVGFSSRGARA